MSDMDIHLSSGAPAYQQIAEQIKSQVAAGRLLPGAQLPTVRELARRLELNNGTVAKAYVELEREGIIVTRRGGGSFIADHTNDSFLQDLRENRLGALLGRAVLEALSLGFEPEDVEASFALHIARWRDNRAKRAIAKPIPTLDSQLVFVGSHDLAIELLFGQLRRMRPDLGPSSVYVGSLAGLIALEQGQAHVAGCHLLDEETGAFNWPYVRRLLPGQDVVLVTVVERQQGLMVPKGNPRQIKDFSDLTRPDIRFVNRQRGAGTRVLLDFKLRQMGIEPARVSGYDHEEDTHIGVASAVAEGSANVGLGISAAARSLGLDFIPVQKERYDLAMLRNTYESAACEPLLQVLRSKHFQRVVTAMGGYDITLTGQVVPGVDR